MCWAEPITLTTNSSRRIGFGLITLAAFLVVEALFWLWPGVFETWENQTTDHLFDVRCSWPKLRPLLDDRLRLITLTDQCLPELGTDYINREIDIRVMNALVKVESRIQAWDLILAAPLGNKTDMEMVDTARKAGNVILGMAFSLHAISPQPPLPYIKEILDKQAWSPIVIGDTSNFYQAGQPVITFSPLAQAALGLGFLNLTTDRDGILRRVPLLLRYGELFLPSLALRAVCEYLEVTPDRIIVNPGQAVVLLDPHLNGRQAQSAISIPIDKKGCIIVNYPGSWEVFTPLRLSEFLLAAGDEDELLFVADSLADRLVLVEDATSAAGDLGAVPTDPTFPLAGVQASIINSILTGQFVHKANPALIYLIELGLMLGLVGLSFSRSSRIFVYGVALLVLSYNLTALLGFMFISLILDTVRPFIMVGLGAIGLGVYRYVLEERERFQTTIQRDHIRSVFGRYLSQEVVDEILSKPDGLALAGETREVTVLVSDLRGFSIIASRTRPEQVIKILNTYFSPMLDIISQYGGTVNELMGDGILAFFGAPFLDSDDPERAVACALAMQGRMAQVNEELLAKSLPALSMGIGINTGSLVVGNIGSQQRAKYAAVGSAINDAFRIESYTVGGQVLISSSTYERVASVAVTGKKIETAFKGAEEPMILREVTGLNGKYQISLPAGRKPDLQTLDTPLAVHCYPLEGKVVGKQGILARILKLGGNSCEILAETRLDLHANYKIDFSLPGSDNSYLYAKVVESDGKDETEGPHRALLDFTWLPEGCGFPGSDLLPPAGDPV